VREWMRGTATAAGLGDGAYAEAFLVVDTR